jgi:prepilin-type N-terminal cleavage/methylation domain-containing protein
MHKKGFTLIELLIVIAIIAILAAGVIIAVNPGRQFREARNSTRWSHMNAIANAVYTYATENQGEYPPCIPAYPNKTDVADCSSDLVPTYMSSLPQDPQSSKGYYYEIGFDNADQNRIKIDSTAPEASGVEVIR